VAAFIGYLAEHPDKKLVEIGETKHLLVFDFGGGTCDVAIFRVSTDLAGNLMVASLSVSRYNRLGGGDIDQAILYEVLLQQLLEQNGLDRHSIDFETKKSVIEPAFIGVAEQLKIGFVKRSSRGWKMMMTSPNLWKPAIRNSSANCLKPSL
jgi:molecular chaperone DnaK (HSP70)